MSLIKIDIFIKGKLCKNTLEFMKIYAKTKTEYERVALLSMHEYKLEGVCDYIEATDEISKPHNKIYIIMAYGLFSNWKQPIYACFDQTEITTTVLTDLIIRNLSQIGYNVVGLVTTCKKYKLWNDLCITVKKPYFEVVISNESITTASTTTKMATSDSSKIKKHQIYVFFESSHLLRLLRRYFLKSGFVLSDKQTEIKKELFEDLLSNYPIEAEMLYGLKSKHFVLKKKLSRKHELQLAEDLISENGGNALREYNSCEMKIYEFFLCIDKWYKLIYNTNKDIKLLYDKSSEQELILNEMFKIMKGMRHIQTTTTTTKVHEAKIFNYQRGILITIKALKGLHKYLLKYSPSIPLNKLSLDSSKQFYNDLKESGLHKSIAPTAAEFSKWTQTLLLRPTYSNNNNTEFNNDYNSYEDYISTSVLNQYNVLPWSQNELTTITDLTAVSEEPSTSIFQQQQTVTNTDDQNDIDIDFASEEDGFRYVIGWVVKQYKSKEPRLTPSEQSSEYLRTPTQYIDGELIRPSKWWIENVRILEDEFILHHKVGLRNDKVMKSLIKKLCDKYKRMPTELIKAFIRQRTLIRLKLLNMKLNGKALKRRKQKLQKIMEKMNVVDETQYSSKLELETEATESYIYVDGEQLETIETAQEEIIETSELPIDGTATIFEQQQSNENTFRQFAVVPKVTVLPVNQRTLPLLFNVKSGTITRPSSYSLNNGT